MVKQRQMTEKNFKYLLKDLIKNSNYFFSLFILSFFLVFLNFSFFSIKADAQNQFHGRKTSLIEKDLLTLIEKASEFHTIFIKKDEVRLKKLIIETQIIIRKIYAKLLHISNAQQRMHSYKILRSLSEQLEILSFSKWEGAKNIKKLFNNFFEFYHFYNLRAKVKTPLFYCKLDKNTWFQSKGLGNKAYNPINSRYRNCGRRIW